MGPDAAAEFHLPGEQPAEQIWISQQLLADVQGSRDVPARIRSDPHGVSASWFDGGASQTVQLPSPNPWDATAFPDMPDEFAENPPGMLSALHEACETADPFSSRYAINCVQLQGASGRIAATDGRQLLVQSGFSFPWDSEVLLPKTSVFGCQDLPDDEPVRIGRTEHWIVVQVGGWTIWQKPNEDGLFPEVDRHLSNASHAAAQLRVEPADARFLLKTLPKLSLVDDYNLPITVDLNGQVALRARVVDQQAPTELHLVGSSYSGKPIQINTNRRYLVRAMSLGFRDLRIFHPKTPILAWDDQRQYLWAPLAPASIILPNSKAVCIPSQET
jgi:hypothetical protein